MKNNELRIKEIDAELILKKSALDKVEKRMLEIKVSSDEWSDLAAMRNNLSVDIHVAKKKMYFAIHEKPYLGSSEIQDKERDREA